MADAWSSASWEALLDDPHSFGKAIVAGDDLVGAVLARVIGDESEILMVVTAPERRRHGLGRSLMTAAIEEAAQRGSSRIFLEVSCDNLPALELYRSLGFVDAGRRTGYYATAGRRTDALVLRRDPPLDARCPPS